MGHYENDGAQSIKKFELQQTPPVIDPMPQVIWGQNFNIKYAKVWFKIQIQIQKMPDINDIEISENAEFQKIFSASLKSLSQ